MADTLVKIISPGSEQSFISDWYAIAGDSHFWMQGRLAALLKQLNRGKIPVRQPLRGLEIGCGHGILRSQIEQNTLWTVDGADLDLASLKNSPACRGETFLYNIFDKQGSFKEHYDFLVLYDVIEHIENVDAFLQACLFHLKPGGHVFINVPALNSLYSAYDKKVGHYRRYDKEMMAKELSKADLEIVCQNYWGVTFLPLLWIRKWMLSKEIKTETIVKKGFSPQSSLINAILKIIITSEIALIPDPILGTSLMAIARKIH